MAESTVSAFRLIVGDNAQLRCLIAHADETIARSNISMQDYALVYVHQGKGRYIDRHRRIFRLESGSVFHRFPGQAHTFILDPPSIRCHIAVPAQVLELLLFTRLVRFDRPVFQMGADKRVFAGFEAIVEELKNRPSEDLALSVVRIQTFLTGLLRRGRAMDTDDYLSEPLRRAVQMLNQDVAARIQMPEVARHAGMSYTVFRRCFAERIGMPPGEFRMRRRIESAMALLSGTSLLVKEVAERLGYPDEYSFSAQFKKLTGSSPTAFRRKQQDGE
jgi:AraC family transcriptional regulator of arabinose operon